MRFILAIFFILPLVTLVTAAPSAAEWIDKPLDSPAEDIDLTNCSYRLQVFAEITTDVPDVDKFQVISAVQAVNQAGTITAYPSWQRYTKLLTFHLTKSNMRELEDGLGTIWFAGAATDSHSISLHIPFGPQVTGQVIEYTQGDETTSKKFNILTHSGQIGSFLILQENCSDQVLDGLLVESASHSETLNNMSSSIPAINSSIATLDDRIREESSASQSRDSSIISNSDERFKAAELKISALESANALLTSQIAALESANTLLTSQIAALEATIRRSSKELRRQIKKNAR